MDFVLSGEELEFVGSVRAYLDGLDLQEVTAEADAGEGEVGPAGRAFLRRLGRDGWLGMGWPEEYGGQGRSAIEQWLFREELTRRRLPDGGLTIGSVGPTIIRVGTEEQKRRYLPGMLRGDIDVAIGYTEPNAGTDLASLETRAARDGEDYVINGQKMFTTGAHYATHIWLAVRTGPADSKHRGITVLMVPLDTPGITVRPLFTQSGTRTNEVFFDDVRVPCDCRVGDENQGWRLIVMALDFERLLPYSRLAREFEDLLVWARGDRLGSELLADSSSRETLARLAIDIEVCRLFATRTACLIDQGEVPNTEASINKVWLSELRQDIACEVLGLIGEEGQLGVGSPGAPDGGAMELAYRASTVPKFGGGTNEIQRNIIAQRGLGLPR
jgi:hypothetical protein